ncbi:MAG: DUF5320 domain-containing protein [Proteobacteria bacterium]|nr:DUF5320 domain-containing protein [Pseudomonadota bacterium]MBU1389775.1 DUF5320 domain-containing protein [Pseudomonadota bacterium]MBU1543784.1 DUF5320 domain-containing protein [Pseudomonadota bacterium]MBU2430726.1 DUF5320 domain-containing protein [Pseudomonadota bacterium]MBU2479589.1 DUF5320 domain-containing protein [Pseudomonadota bacterium]
MPGFNQRGPANQGPMTGRGRGVCTGNSNLDQGFSAGGYPMGRGAGRRGCMGSGRRNGQGIGWGQNAGRWATGSAPAVSTRTALQNRADMLEAQLAEIKNQLDNNDQS